MYSFTLLVISYLRGLGVKYYDEHYFGYDILYLFGLTTTYFYATLLNDSVTSYLFNFVVSMLWLVAYVYAFNLGIYDSNFVQESETVSLEKPNHG